MKFEVLSKAAYDALSEREQVKYELQLEQFKAEEAKRIAKENATEAVEEMRKELKEELEKEFTEANEKALKEFADKNQVELDDVKAQLKRAKVGEVAERMKDFSSHIVDKLSGEEGEKMIMDFFKGQRERLNFDVDADSLKAIITMPSGAVAPDFLPIVGPGHDDIHARNAIPVFPTISDVVKFVRMTYTNGSNAGFATVGKGVEKPELLYTSALEEANVRKIAGWLNVPDEIMDDVVGFRAWLAFELPKAYLDAEDLQVFKGDGLGTNLLGVWTQADYQSAVFGSVTVATANHWDQLMAAITEIRTRKRSTSAVFVSPIYYMELWINKGVTEEYSYPVVMSENGILSVAGVPVYWSNSFEDYEGIAGDFARGCSIHQRKAMNIAYSTENKDNFVTNVITVRLEGRIALAIRVPDAFLRLGVVTT